MAKTLIDDKKLDALIRHRVAEVVQDMLNDPDYGLELRPEFVKRLKKSVESKKAGRVVPFSEIKEKYQLSNN